MCVDFVQSCLFENATCNRSGRFFNSVYTPIQPIDALIDRSKLAASDQFQFVKLLMIPRNVVLLNEKQNRIFEQQQEQQQKKKHTQTHKKKTNLQSDTFGGLFDFHIGIVQIKFGNREIR